jgi:hypothetical protein
MRRGFVTGDVYNVPRWCFLASAYGITWLFHLAGRFPFGTLKVKSDEVTEIESEVATGTRKLQSLPGARKLDWRKTDKNLVFVAGATGGVGSRLVRSGCSYLLFC